MNPTLQRTLYISLALISLSGLIAPALALGLGIAFVFLFENPYPKQTSRFSKAALQWSIVGLGFAMNLQSVIQHTMDSFWIITLTIIGTLLAGLALGRLFKVDKDTSLLVSSGTAICGGSAIAAVAPVSGAKPEHISVALGIVFTLNAIALFLFPPIGEALSMTQQQFGLWAAIAIHDTSSVVGAAAHYGKEALELAVTVKLMRALMIIPLVLLIALFWKKSDSRIKIPWFILYFVIAVGFGTLVPGLSWLYAWLHTAALSGLSLALFLIGASLSRSALKSVGIQPMIQGVVLWILISVISLTLILQM